MSDSNIENLREKLEQLIEKEAFEEIRELLKDIHPADIAFIFPKLDRTTINMIFDLLEPEAASDVLIELDDHAQEKVLRKMDDDRLAEIVDELETDEAADVLGSVEPEVAEKVLETLDEETREEVQQLLEYPEDTAGGIMSTDLVAVKDEQTVIEAVREVQKNADEVEEIYGVWVTDNNNKLLGRITLKDLVIAKADTKIKELIHKDFQSVPVDMDQEEVAHMMKRYDLVSVPVVDKEGYLLGRITWDDAMEVLEEESSEDMAYFSGTGEEEPSTRSVLHSTRERFPWLLTGLLGGIVSAVVMSEFVNSLQALITLTFFVPIITGMGGNVGIQSSTIVVRGLATGEISFQDTGQRILKELGVALLNGLILSTILAVIIYFWMNMLIESLVIALSLLTVILVATFIGVTAPLMLKKMNIDPALAMGPFVTISNDIVGVFIYLYTATYLLMR